MEPSLFQTMFSRRHPIIAMIHVFEDELSVQRAQALEDLGRLEGSVDGVIVENYDCGYADRNRATTKMVNTLFEITRAVVKRSSIPVGVNVLPNDYEHAFTIASLTGARFIQMDHATGVFAGCASVDPEHLQWFRDVYPDIAVLGGIHPKYYELIDPRTPIERSARIARDLTDAIVVTGKETGAPTSLPDLRAVKRVVGDHPVLVGSGLTVETVPTVLAIADGAIVGTAFKRNGVRPREPIDADLCKTFMAAVNALR